MAGEDLNVKVVVETGCDGVGEEKKSGADEDAEGGDDGMKL